jgi:hypothetical protein
LIPALRKIVIMGHQLLSDDCSKLRPTNAVSHNHRGSCATLNPTLANTTVPAMPRNHAFTSNLMFASSVQGEVDR